MTFLGLDCGGTKTRTAWWPRGVHELGTGAAVQPASHGVEAASRALVERIRTADPRSEAEAIVAAIAGAGDATIRSELLRAVAAAGIATKVAIVGDTLAAAAAVLETGPGALVFAGTGSFAVVRAVDGTLHRTGGRGHLLGDLRTHGRSRGVIEIGAGRLRDAHGLTVGPSPLKIGWSGPVSSLSQTPPGRCRPLLRISPASA